MAPSAVLAYCTWFTGLDRLARCLNMINGPGVSAISELVRECAITILVEMIRSAGIDMISSPHLHVAVWSI